MEELVVFALIVVLTTFAVNIGIALYGIFAKRSLLKKVMSLIIFNDSINILTVSVGFRIPDLASPSPPVLPSIPSDVEGLETFTAVSVDPLPQAFVITAVVIGFSITLFLIGLMTKYYEHYGTLDLLTYPEEDMDEEVI